MKQNVNSQNSLYYLIEPYFFELIKHFPLKFVTLSFCNTSDRKHIAMIIQILQNQVTCIFDRNNFNICSSFSFASFEMSSWLTS